VPGVWKVTVKFNKEEALVEFDAKRTDIDKLSDALRSVGYEGSLKSWPKGG
jgi:copper chaperone CopZ